eukprot:TRINITY_DN5947_c0_g2_i1.p1 TRINITY_DN5947_c0_g2~~TRINITY_DN5947_c0_g2_i1.p1  ORF type:complete len:482 (+),score=150.06 TRINITY_DN5947_c0_g2_i1:137-1582(+)
MSYSADLLDGFDLLNKRAEGVLKHSGNVADFFKSLSSIEKDYAKKLQQLASKQKASFQKESSHVKEVGTSFSAWDSMLTELERVAEHHRQYSDSLDNDLCKAIENWTKEKSKSRKKLEGDSQRISRDMRTQLDNLSKARSKYVSLSKEAEKDEATHTKGKGDLNMKPNQLAKLAANASKAADKAAASDNEYQAILSTTNQKQSEYWLSTMPALLGEFQQFEEERLDYMKKISEKFSDIFAEKPAFYTSASDAITSATRSIDVDSDIQTYVAENKTGATPPADVPYMSWDSELPSTPKGRPAGKPSPAPGKFPYKAAQDKDILTSKEWGLSSSDYNLGVDAQRNKLYAQLDELDKAITSENKSKDGLENLVKFYASDPVAQKKAEDEISEIETKLQRLYDTRLSVQGTLDQIGGGGGAPSGSGAGRVKARGVYDYAATCDTELSFREGDILNITEQDDSGWWYAELNGKSGFVPNNYVELVR